MRELIAYEAGYRTTIAHDLSIDVATFYTTYDHQQTTEPAAAFFENSPAPAHTVLPFTFQNLDARRGARIRDSGELEGHGSVDAQSQGMPSSRFTCTWKLRVRIQAPSPMTKAPVRSTVRSYDRTSICRHGISWDVSGYFVDRLKSGGAPAYTRLDTGLTWRWTEALSMTVVGQDLWKDRHVEFVDNSGSVRSTLIKRSIYGKLTWQF